MKKIILLFLFISVVCADNNFFKFHSITFMYSSPDNENTILNDITKSDNWIHNTVKLNKGFSKKPYWLKVNISKELINSYILINNYMIENINMYIIKQNKVIEKFQSGLKHKVSKNLMDFRKPTLFIKEEYIGYDLYIKVFSDTYPINISLQQLSKDAFLNKKAFDTSIMLTYFTILFLMIIYNLILTLIIKMRYLYIYLIYLSSLFITGFYTSGYLQDFIFTNGLNNIIIGFFQTIGIIMLFSLLYLICILLDLKKVIKKSFYILAGALLFLFSIGWIIYLCNEESFPPIQYALQFTTILILLYVSYFLIKRTFKKDLFSFIISMIWIPLCLGISLFITNQVVYSYDPLIVEYLIKGLFLYETIFISLLLAYNMKVLQDKNNQMSLLLKEQEIQLIQAQKFSSMGEMLNNIAHQWKQPLARINSIIFKTYNLIQKDKKEKSKQELLRIETETEYMSNTISSLLSFFQKNKNSEHINLYEVVQNEILYLKEYHKEICIKVDCLNKEIVVIGCKNTYEQVIKVIIENAIDTFKENHTQIPCIRFQISKDYISIENNGSKIEENNMDRIFEPFFTTKNLQNHQGIGLYMSKMLIEESMKKRLKVENTTFGVKFTIEG